MSSPATHFKLGLFALAALVGLVAAAFGLGLRAVQSATDNYHTYFDESVQGLEIGSPVKYRGVWIGSVTRIAIAPDRKHVDVELAVHERDARRLGLAESTPAVRAQLASQGITGVKFVDIDFFDGSPIPTLPFTPARNYLPARPSLLKGLSDNLDAIGQRFPEIVDRAAATLDKLGRVLDDVHDERIVSRVGELVDRTTVAAADVQRLVRHVDRANLPERTGAALDSVDRTASQARGVLDHIDGSGGLVASAHRATDAFGDLGRGSLSSTEVLEQTIRDLGEAARAVRDFVETLDRDPDILIKGRARTNKP